MIYDPTIPQFTSDYIISWDVSDKDHPCISVARLGRDEKGSRLELEVLGTSLERTGVVSLLQLLDHHRAIKRAEEERAERTRKNAGETIAKAIEDMKKAADAIRRGE